MVKKLEFKYSGSVRQDQVRSSDLKKVYGDFLLDNFGYGDPEDLYRYAGVDINTTYTTLKKKKKKTKEAKQLILEKEYVIELGGPFEQIGGEEDLVGGGKQKIGSKQ